ncbi:MAG: hypothetical protein ACJA2S_005294, partial [Cyclobacteriaceae bacterium]
RHRINSLNSNFPPVSLSFGQKIEVIWNAKRQSEKLTCFKSD